MTMNAETEKTAVLPGQRRLKIRAASAVVKMPSTELMRALRAVSLAASSDVDRPHLRAVHFHVSDELVITATDGHWLAQWKCEPEEMPTVPLEMLVDLTDVQRLIPLLAVDAKAMNQVSIDFETGTVDLTDGTVLPFTKLQQEPPPYNTLWPTTDAVGTSRIGLTVALMSRVQKAFKEAGGPDTCMRMTFRGATSGVYVDCQAAPEFAALVMPARIEDGEPET